MARPAIMDTPEWRDQVYGPGEALHVLGPELPDAFLCPNPKCGYTLSDKDMHNVEQDDGMFYCPNCHGNYQLFDPNEFSPGGVTRSNLTLRQVGDIGERIIAEMGEIPGLGRITEDLSHLGKFAETDDGAPDFIVAGHDGVFYAAEVKSNDARAQERFKMGGLVERQKKYAWALERGYKPILVGVRLNFYNDQAQVFVQPHGFKDTWYGSKNLQHVATVSFADKNPFKQPAPQEAQKTAAFIPYTQLAQTGDEGLEAALRAYGLEPEKTAWREEEVPIQELLGQFTEFADIEDDEDYDYIQRMMDSLQSGWNPPPVHVVDEGAAGRTLIDGFHRVIAQAEMGSTSVSAYVLDEQDPYGESASGWSSRMGTTWRLSVTVTYPQDELRVRDPKGKHMATIRRCANCGHTYWEKERRVLECPTCGRDTRARAAHVKIVLAGPSVDQIAREFGWEFAGHTRNGERVYQWTDEHGVRHKVQVGSGAHGKGAQEIDAQKGRARMRNCMKGNCQHGPSEDLGIEEGVPEAPVLQAGQQVTYGGKRWWVAEIAGGLVAIYDPWGGEDVVPIDQVRMAMVYDPVQWAQDRPPKLYHGTTMARARRILQEGLKPQGSGSSNWVPETLLGSRPGHVYLTEDPGLATFHTTLQDYSDADPDSGALLEIDTAYLDPALINPDEDWVQENQADPDLIRNDEWKQSINQAGGLGQWAENVGLGDDPATTQMAFKERGDIAYRGIVPPEAITLITEDHPNYRQLTAWAKTAEWRPESEGMTFQVGDRVRVPSGEVGTISMLEEALTGDPEHCGTCHHDQEDHDEHMGCRACEAESGGDYEVSMHDYQPAGGETSNLARVKLDSGRTVAVYDSALQFVEGLEGAMMPDTLPPEWTAKTADIEYFPAHDTMPDAGPRFQVGERVMQVTPRWNSGEFDVPGSTTYGVVQKLFDPMFGKWRYQVLWENREWDDGRTLDLVDWASSAAGRSNIPSMENDDSIQKVAPDTLPEHWSKTAMAGQEKRLPESMAAQPWHSEEFLKSDFEIDFLVVPFTVRPDGQFWVGMPGHRGHEIDWQYQGKQGDIQGAVNVAGQGYQVHWPERVPFMPEIEAKIEAKALEEVDGWRREEYEETAQGWRPWRTTKTAAPVLDAPTETGWAAFEQDPRMASVRRSEAPGDVDSAKTAQDMGASQIVTEEPTDQFGPLDYQGKFRGQPVRYAIYDETRGPSQHPYFKDTPGLAAFADVFVEGPEWVNVAYVTTAPEARGRGHARALMQHIYDQHPEARIRWGRIEHDAMEHLKGDFWSRLPERTAMGQRGDLPPQLHIEHENKGNLQGTYISAWIVDEQLGNRVQIGGMTLEPSGLISGVEVEPEWQRRGVADAMYFHAREHGIPIYHDWDNMTAAGEAWARKLDPDEAEEHDEWQREFDAWWGENGYGQRNPEYTTFPTFYEWQAQRYGAKRTAAVQVESDEREPTHRRADYLWHKG